MNIKADVITAMNYDDVNRKGYRVSKIIKTFVGIHVFRAFKCINLL